VGTLYLIRHGQASYGETDYDRLSTRGEEQARAIGRHLAHARLDALFAGPLRRQQQTAAFAAEAAGIPLPTPTTLDGLAEYPAFEMLKHFVPMLVADDPKFAELETAPTPRLLDEAFKEVLGRWARDEWSVADARREAPPEGGAGGSSVEGLERAAGFVDRVRSAYDMIIRAARSGARIGCVTSAGPIGVAMGLVFGLPAERMIRTSIVVRNASITELAFRTGDFAWHPDKVSLVTFNTTGHLPPELVTDR